MLNKEEIKKNKESFIGLLKKIKRPDAQIEGLINKLEKSDFFTAPASTNYHSSYEGGLCKHSLNVYEQLVKLCNIEYPKKKVEETKEDGSVEIKYENTCPYSEETLIIVSLLHDISKMNFYETSLRNVKNEKGEWVQVPFIKTKEAKDRFIYSTHGANSEFMVRTFIPLTIEESCTIINHMGGKESGSNGFDNNLSEIFNRYSLAILLHSADMLATFFTEKLF